MSLAVCFLRLIQLMEEIMAEKENKTIIFAETKKRCDDLTRRMRRDGWVMWLVWIHKCIIKNVLLRPKMHSHITCLSIWSYPKGYCVFLGGQRCVFMVTRASQRETGCCQVQKHVNISSTVTYSVVNSSVIVSLSRWCWVPDYFLLQSSVAEKLPSLLLLMWRLVVWVCPVCSSAKQIVCVYNDTLHYSARYLTF